MKKINLLLVIQVLLFMVSCTVKVPDTYIEVEDRVSIYPDYTDVTIPYNIAPLNFYINEDADEYITSIGGNDEEKIICKGKDVRIDIKKWHSLLAVNKGKDILFEIYYRKGKNWYKVPPIKNHISSDSIDPYISYRLIEPSYVVFKSMSLRQRNLTSFEEKDIFNNQILSDRNGKQCINCHSYQNYRTDNMQFHARQVTGGTMIVSDGKPQKVNIKTGELISAGVYPAWHPSEKLIAYSVNNTKQVFYSKDNQKIEVLDTESGLVLYNVETNEVSIISNNPNSMETFPAWSPDGKMFYYASAYFELEENNLDRDFQVKDKFREIKYDIIRMPFDIETHRFGQMDTIVYASQNGKSVTLPRVSPDGNYLLYTIGDYGTFHIWHHSSDLQLLDLKTGEIDKLEVLNSDAVESYHSWSSNGRWIVFSTRRDDGSYTRPYISYFDRDGKASKPFALPQEDPLFYTYFLKSFNIPEFMVEPVKVSVEDFADAFRKEAVQAKMVKTS